MNRGANILAGRLMGVSRVGSGIRSVLSEWYDGRTESGWLDSTFDVEGRQ